MYLTVVCCKRLTSFVWLLISSLLLAYYLLYGGEWYNTCLHTFWLVDLLRIANVLESVRQHIGVEQVCARLLRELYGERVSLQRSRHMA